MPVVIRVRALDGFRLDVEFDDATRGFISMADRLFGPVFEPLQDPTFFEQVHVDGFGAICWPNGADLASDTIYHCLSASTNEDWLAIHASLDDMANGERGQDYDQFKAQFLERNRG